MYWIYKTSFYSIRSIAPVCGPCSGYYGNSLIVDDLDVDNLVGYLQVVEVFDDPSFFFFFFFPPLSI